MVFPRRCARLGWDLGDNCNSGDYARADESDSDSDDDCSYLLAEDGLCRDSAEMLVQVSHHGSMSALVRMHLAPPPPTHRATTCVITPWNAHTRIGAGQ